MNNANLPSGAADRVNAYLDRRAKMRGIDKEVIHGMDGVDFELTVSDLRALAASAPVAPTPPAWRELCRRLYVELFHCDKQMTCSLNEDGEPIWRTGPEVRDVLSDAKAALEANPATPQAAPVAPAPAPEPEPEPAPAPMPYPTDAQVDAVYEQTMSQPLRSQDAPAVRRFGRAMFLCAWNAAAPKADHIPDAGKMAAAPQQGEYLPLTQTDIDRIVPVLEPVNGAHYPAEWALWNDRERIRAELSAHLAARGAAQAAPAGAPDLLEDYDLENLAHSANQEALSYGVSFDVFNRLARTVRDRCTTAQPAPVVEDVENFDTWLVKQFEFRNYYFTQRGPALMAVPFARRAYEAGRAAQPEGGAHANR